MSSYKFLRLAGGLVIAASFGLPAAAQLNQAEPDPLARMRQQAAANSQVCSADEASACAQAAPKIIANALGASPLADNLRRLTDEVGGRVTGSPAMARAVAWGLAAFREAGVDDVHTEKYTIPVTWSEGNSRLEVLSPDPFPVRMVSVAWSPATPASGIEAAVVDAGTGSESDFSRIGGNARGAILLVHTAVLRSLDDLLSEYMRGPAIIDRSVAARASAILWMSTREGLLLYRHLNGAGLDGKLDKLPQAIVAREDALRMARDLTTGAKLRVRLELPNHIGGPSEQENVVAEIRGRERTDEFVVLGAHLDSWELGTGALDDGCNASMVVEAARDIHLTGLRPRRSIHFVLFSGEEQGMLGSWAYVHAHRAEMDRTVAAILFDEGSGRTTGFSLGGRRDIEPAVRQALAPIESWNVDRHTADAFVGTDNLDFLLEGVPNLVANQDPANYVANYHAASDTYDKVDLLTLKENTAIAGILAFSLAEFAKPPGPRFSRAETEALLKQTGLDAQMKAFDVWRYWESGQRGRQP
jgi:carboxypeptidase Q